MCFIAEVCIPDDGDDGIYVFIYDCRRNFVSRLVGSNALSAVNIVYPVINLMFACGIMLSTGGSAIVARQIGEKKESEARENFSLIALVSFLVGVVILAVGILFLEPLCNVLGATPLILSDCKRYWVFFYCLDR